MIFAHPAVSLRGKQAPYEIWLNAPVGVIHPDAAMELARALVQAASLAEWGGPGLGIDGPPQAAARPVPDAKYCCNCGTRQQQNGGGEYGCCKCGYSAWADLDGIISRIFRSLQGLWTQDERRGPVGGGR